jgi:hypothetical protein
MQKTDPTDMMYSNSRWLFVRRGSFNPYIINLHLEEAEYINKYKPLNAYCNDTDIILCKYEENWL